MNANSLVQKVLHTKWYYRLVNTHKEIRQLCLWWWWWSWPTFILYYYYYCYNYLYIIQSLYHKIIKFNKRQQQQQKNTCYHHYISKYHQYNYIDYKNNYKNNYRNNIYNSYIFSYYDNLLYRNSIKINTSSFNNSVCLYKYVFR